MTQTGYLGSWTGYFCEAPGGKGKKWRELSGLTRSCLAEGQKEVKLGLCHPSPLCSSAGCD